MPDKEEEESINPSKIKITVTQALKYGFFLFTVLSTYFKIQYDIERGRTETTRNAIDIAAQKEENKKEFKEVHKEFKAVLQKMSEDREKSSQENKDILEKIDQKHSK